MSRPPLSGMALVLATIALGLGTFIQILDTSIANVAVPHIAGDLAVSPNQGTWVITSFAVSNAIVLPLTGWLSKRFGEVRLFVWSTTLFSFVSFLCGIAWNLPVMIFFRVLQGAVAGTLIPLSQTLLLVNYPEDKKQLALGLWSMIVIVAPVMGPVLGGWLTDDYGWPWIFYINVPIGLLSAFLTRHVLKDRESEIQRNPMDILGLILLVVGVAALQIMLDKGNDDDWFESNFIIGLGITAFVCISLFIPWNYLSPFPVVEFSFFRLRNFTLGTIVLSLGYMAFFGGIVVLPLWLQTQMGYTAFWAGVAVAPIGLIPVVLSPLVGQYMNKVDLRWVATFSYTMFVITFLWMTNFNTDISIWNILLPRFVQGLAVACFFIPLISLTLSEIPNNQLSSASGVSNFLRILTGSGFGTAIFVTIWTRREIFHYSRITENVNIYNPMTIAAVDQIETDLGVTREAAYGVMDVIAQQQAFMMSTNDIFFLSAMLFLSLIPVIWLCKGTKTGGNAKPVPIE